MGNKQEIKTIDISKTLLDHLNNAIRAALIYEKETGYCRKLGITGEVGEVLACHKLRLRLVCDPRSAGYDAVDGKEKKVQIKTRKSEEKGLPRDAGRMGTFSAHRFDYALLVLLDHEYKLCEIWKAKYKNLLPIIQKHKRRNPPLSAFKMVAVKI